MAFAIDIPEALREETGRISLRLVTEEVTGLGLDDVLGMVEDKRCRERVVVCATSDLMAHI